MNVEFKMKDNLIIRGVLEGKIEANDLVIMLHSGGYDRNERGVKQNKNGKKCFYNPRGNYEYLSDILKSDAAILRIDLRNHGLSGKNIDTLKMLELLKEFNITSLNARLICSLLLQNDKIKLKEVIEGLKLDDKDKMELKQLVKRPIIKDSSFYQMRDDIKEILEQIGGNYQNYHFVGTCMGGLISALYIMDNPLKVKSLSLFSPLFTLDQAFLRSDSNDTFSYHKRQVIKNGGQFRMGNQVEGIKTYQEVASFRPMFYENLKKINVPICAFQGVEDKLVNALEQEKIFAFIENYHKEKGLMPVYYASISPGVHSLYDVIYPVIMEVGDFIKANLSQNLKR